MTADTALTGLTIADTLHRIGYDYSRYLGGTIDAVTFADRAGFELARCDQTMARADLAELRRLRVEREPGPMTQACPDPECSVRLLGAGYGECPRCGSPLGARESR